MTVGERSCSQEQSETSAEAGVIVVDTRRVSGAQINSFDDRLAVEKPLEVRIIAEVGGERLSASVAVTMRTPGKDKELAVGFLFTEGILNSVDDIDQIVQDKCSVVQVQLKAGVAVDAKFFDRYSFVASSCGVCGKKSIAAVRVRRHFQSIKGSPVLDPALIHALPAALRAVQSNFESTGGIHASALFDTAGNIIEVKEDVGRHNALDKVIGAQLLKGHLPLNNNILLVSGRASFELVQKAAHAGIPLLAAVGAPSSLAVELALESGTTLIGFVRNGRFNIYTGAERIISAEH